MATLEDVLKDFDRRLQILEKGSSVESPAPVIERPPTPPRTELQTSWALGVVGIIFVILAGLFFVKLTIDSGWLTPLRQMLLATFVGLSFIALPHVVQRFKDSYGSLLSGAGVAILHGTWLSAYSFHHIVDGNTALICATLIGLLSILWNLRFANEVFVLVAVAGTYVSAPLLGVNQAAIPTILSFIYIWDISFSWLALNLKRRDVLIIASFLGILSGGWLMSLHPIGPAEAKTFLILQLFQFVIFSTSSTYYSLKHQEPLSRDQSWAICLLLLIFYRLTYSSLEVLFFHFAPFFGILIAGIVYGIHSYAQKRNSEIVSGPALYTFVAIVLVHSVYFNLMPEDLQPLASCLLLFILKPELWTKKEWKWPMNIGLAVVGWGFLLSFLGNYSKDVSLAYHVMWGLVALFVAGRTLHKSAILSLGHFQMLTALFLLADKLSFGSFFVSLFWGMYAAAILVWGLKKKDFLLGQSAILILVAVSVKATFYDLLGTNNLTRVISLLSAGLLLYGCGYLYKQIKKWKVI